MVVLQSIGVVVHRLETMFAEGSSTIARVELGFI